MYRRVVGQSRQHSACLGKQKHNVQVWTIDGAPQVVEIVQGTDHFVPLIRLRTIKRRGKRSTRWYNVYRIPAAPEVRSRLWNATITLRLDDEHVTNNHLAIAPGDPDWDRVFGVRNRAESVNSWIKDCSRLRAPCLGRARQRFAVLCGLILYNFRALLRYCQKTNQDVLKLVPTPPP